MPARKESPIPLELRLNDDGALLRRRRLEGATQKSYSPTGDDVSDVDGRRPRAVVEVRARAEVMLEADQCIWTGLRWIGVCSVLVSRWPRCHRSGPEPGQSRSHSTRAEPDR